jgi:hypothetical protein
VTDEQLMLVAKIVSGLQVPASLDGPMMLGAAYNPWCELRDSLNLFGWLDTEETYKRLKNDKA